MVFDSKHDSAPPTFFLGVPLCPGMWVSPRSKHCSSAYSLAGASLPMDVGYLLTVPAAPRSFTMYALRFPFTRMHRLRKGG